MSPKLCKQIIDLWDWVFIPFQHLIYGDFKLPQIYRDVPFFFITGTMGAAQSANCIGSMMDTAVNTLLVNIRKVYTCPLWLSINLLWHWLRKELLTWGYPVASTSWHSLTSHAPLIVQVVEGGSIRAQHKYFEFVRVMWSSWWAWPHSFIRSIALWSLVSWPAGKTIDIIMSYIMKNL